MFAIYLTNISSFIYFKFYLCLCYRVLHKSTELVQCNESRKEEFQLELFAAFLVQLAKWTWGLKRRAEREVGNERQRERESKVEWGREVAERSSVACLCVRVCVCVCGNGKSERIENRVKTWREKQTNKPHRTASRCRCPAVAVPLPQPSGFPSLPARQETGHRRRCCCWVRLGEGQWTHCLCRPFPFPFLSLFVAFLSVFRVFFAARSLRCGLLWLFLFLLLLLLLWHVACGTAEQLLQPRSMNLQMQRNRRKALQSKGRERRERSGRVWGGRHLKDECEKQQRKQKQTSRKKTWLSQSKQRSQDERHTHTRTHTLLLQSLLNCASLQRCLSLSLLLAPQAAAPAPKGPATLLQDKCVCLCLCVCVCGVCVWIETCKKRSEATKGKQEEERV